MSIVNPTSTNRSGTSQALHHPLGKQHWPNMFEEARDMLDTSVFCYWAGDVRKLIKEKKLTDESTVDALYHMPSTFTALALALEKANDCFLTQQKSNPASYELYSNILGDLSKRYTEISESVGDPEFCSLLHFEDDCEGIFGGPVFAIVIDHALRRVIVGFRGSVTTRDFICDLKMSMHDIPNPIAGESRSGRDYIKIHHGFKEYLYDPTIETVNSEGVSENQSLVLHLVTKVAKIFEDHPEYHLYTAGHSLGGALATLFAMEAGASKDLRIRKPVTCITIASPRVGNLCFAQTFMELEKSRRVRCLRIVNDDDLIPEMPVSANGKCFHPICSRHQVYRHVGLTCKLNRSKNLSLSYPRHYDHPVRLFLSDAGVMVRHVFSASWWAPLVCACQSTFTSNHSCKEYYERLKAAQKDLSKMHLNQLYGKQKKEMLRLELVEASARAVLLG